MTTEATSTHASNGTHDELNLDHAPYTDSQKRDIRTLATHQKHLGMNHTEFTRGSSLDSTTWSRTRRGEYKGNVARVITEMKRHVKQITTQQAIKENRAAMKLDSREFIEFNEYTALREAVNACMAASDREDEDKLVIYVAPSGGGKTCVGKQLRDHEGFNAIMITGRPSWATSYYPAVMAIAKELGVHDGLRSSTDAESAVLDKMASGKGVLIVNEVELLCRAVRHLFRSILNETEWSVVLLVTPQGYRNLTQKPSSDSAQLLRRCESIINASVITPEQVQRFVELHWQLSPELRAGSIEIAKEANQFGCFDFVVRVIDLLAEDLKGSGTSPTLDHITTKIKAARRAVPLVKTTLNAA
jgi:hypothetical protein